MSTLFLREPSTCCPDRHIRGGDRAVLDRVAALDGAVLMSVVSRVELEGGVYREPSNTGARRARLDAMLGAIPTVAFDAAAADVFGSIVAHAGYSQRKLLDRMIAAQALMHRATLVTRNANTFGDIPGLALLVW